MKYDCNKTVDFIHEFNRMCSKEHDCDCCQFQNICDCTGLISIKNTTTGDIDKLQKWSDASPELTMQQKFFEMFPDASKDKDGFPVLCPKNIGWVKKCFSASKPSCKKCWQQPYTKPKQ